MYLDSMKSFPLVKEGQSRAVDWKGFFPPPFFSIMPSTQREVLEQQGLGMGTILEKMSEMVGSGY